MSVQTVYDKISIKVSDGVYMPVILTGDSNVYGWQGRSRFWDAFKMSHGFWGTVEQMDACCNQSFKNGVDSYENYCSALGVKISGTKGTFGNYKGLFVAATNKSIPFDVLLDEFGAEVQVTCKDGDKYHKVNVASADELMALNDERTIVGIRLVASVNLGRHIRRKYYPRGS